MDAVLSGVNVFSIDSYWKIAFWIIVLSAVSAWGCTRALKNSWNRYYLSKIPVVRPPWWRATMLQVFSCGIGTWLGVMIDMTVLPINEIESKMFLSCLFGFLGGLFCTSIVYLLTEKLSEKFPRAASFINKSSGDWGNRVELNSNPNLPVYVLGTQELDLQKSTGEREALERPEPEIKKP